jgi:hypothetical protein
VPSADREKFQAVLPQVGVEGIGGCALPVLAPSQQPGIHKVGMALAHSGKASGSNMLLGQDDSLEGDEAFEFLRRFDGRNAVVRGQHKKSLKKDEIGKEGALLALFEFVEEPYTPRNLGSMVLGSSTR